MYMRISIIIFIYVLYIYTHIIFTHKSHLLKPTQNPNHSNPLSQVTTIFPKTQKNHALLFVGCRPVLLTVKKSYVQYMYVDFAKELRINLHFPLVAANTPTLPQPPHLFPNHQGNPNGPAKLTANSSALKRAKRRQTKRTSGGTNGWITTHSTSPRNGKEMTII